MTTAINAGLPTLLDLVKRQDPNGASAQVIEALTAKSPLLQDMVFVEGNLPTGHRFTSRTALPSVSWRRFNEGVAASKSRTSQVDEVCGMLSGVSKVDADLIELNGGPGFRASEDIAFLEALKQEMESSMFYASTASAPEEINGLAPRFNATTDPGGSQIILCDSDASGSDQTSLWLVGWGPKAVHGIYPKGSKSGGVVAHDMGVTLVDDGKPDGSNGTLSGKQFRAYVTMWDWKIGLCVEDWRHVTRVCNIDATDIAAATSNVLEASIDAKYQVLGGSGVRYIWYCNMALATYLHKAARNDVKSGGGLNFANVGGQEILSLHGWPIHVTDAITSAEAVIS